MEKKDIVNQLLFLLPYWHYKIERPLKQVQKEMKISFETYYCLLLLSHQESMTMTDLANYFHMSKQQVTKLTNNLYEYHFIKRSFDQKDRRIIKISITKKALDYMENNQINDQYLSMLHQEFTEEEILALQNYIADILKILTHKKNS